MINHLGVTHFFVIISILEEIPDIIVSELLLNNDTNNNLESRESEQKQNLSSSILNLKENKCIISLNENKNISSTNAAEKSINYFIFYNFFSFVT